MPVTFPVWGTRQGPCPCPCPSVRGVSMPRMPAMPDLEGGAGQGEAGGSWNTPHFPNSSRSPELPPVLWLHSLCCSQNSSGSSQITPSSQNTPNSQCGSSSSQFPAHGSCSCQTCSSSQNSCSSQSWFLQLLKCFLVPKFLQFPKQLLAVGVAPPSLLPNCISLIPSHLRCPQCSENALWIHLSSPCHLQPW